MRSIGSGPSWQYEASRPPTYQRLWPSSRSVERMPNRPKSPIATLFPGIFAVVMATGIIAVASKQQGIDWLADALYVAAALMYVVLIVLLLARVIRYPG